ncbi:winged helix-turn-helix domain-containing protein [Paenibacillus lemnae]|uniref:Winged helix-turn-helix domain-containing protein n=2 Tax=Paenibacillus lemnae TaxID=1330551 RepID=A0A848M8B0_PAELE|nr:helix-turn-helix domain-containing protein [Paenibacillus lemnae]NMO96451.1 winged helix-turn-helix domain-containing protein [Paenibacillus lemnae]
MDEAASGGHTPGSAADCAAVKGSAPGQAAASAAAAVPVPDLPVLVDGDLGLVQVRGREIRLKPMEFKLLSYLMEHRNRALSKGELFRSVWGDVITGDGTLNVHIRHLREKIEEDANNPRWILTVWGTGYVFKDGV